MDMLRTLMRGLVDIIYPKTCVACKTKLTEASSVDNLVCCDCWSKIKRNLPPFCHFCGRHLEKKQMHKHVCSACVRKRMHFDRAFSPFVYDGVIKDLIHEFKYKNKDYLGQVLSRPLIDFIKEYDLSLDELDYIVPVPLHEAKLREREFNQASILGNFISREFNKEILDGYLIRHKPTRTQTDLDEDERFLNVKDSFMTPSDKRIKGKNILLVDDVLTTAATCSEAALTLKRSGAHIVFVLTLAN